MRLLTILGEILPITGTLLILGLWFFQQNRVEALSKELLKISSARNAYQTYQANNELYNALFEISDQQTHVVLNLRKFQMNNLERALAFIEKVLTKQELAGVPSAMNFLPINGDVYTAMANTKLRISRTNERINTLLIKLEKKENALRVNSEAIKSRYNLYYILISIISISGAILKAIDKLKPSKAK